jgi:hypothetical protein
VSEHPYRGTPETPEVERTTWADVWYEWRAPPAFLAIGIVPISAGVGVAAFTDSARHGVGMFAATMAAAAGIVAFGRSVG